jgi:GT2 family glycosyltransferase
MDVKAMVLRIPAVKRVRRALRRRREAANRALIARHVARGLQAAPQTHKRNFVVNAELPSLEPQAPTGRLRIVAPLDKQALAALPARHVRFHVGPVENHAGAPPMIVSATIIARGEPRALGRRRRERRVAPVARNLRAPLEGFTFRLAIGAEWQAAIQAAAIAAAGDRNVSLHVAIELEQAGDCTVAGLSVGDDPVWALTEESRPAFEDPNIAAQASLIGLADQPAARGRYFPSVEVVVCVHDALNETIACLESLCRSADRARRITIVDDGSTAATVERLRANVALNPWLSLIELGERRGYTKAANIGLRAAAADWVVLLNSDTIVTAGWLEGLLEAAERAGADFVGPLSNAASWQSVPEVRDAAGGWKVNLIPSDQSIESFAALVAELSERAAPRAPLLNGFCMLMRRDAVAALGYLDETNFPSGYGEETDLCLRAAAAGYSLAIADHVYVHHVKSASFGSSRAALSRQGNERLRAKHPRVDLAALQQEMATIPALLGLRRKLRARLGQAAEEARRVVS